MQIFRKSGLPFAEVPCLHQSNLHMKRKLREWRTQKCEVPCLHQSNLHMKRKLREWRTQKCNPCFGAESPPRSTGQQTTRFHAAPYRTVSANFPKVGASFRRGTVFAPIQSTYEKEATGMETQKCNPCFGAESPPRSTGQQTTRFHAAPYRTVSANFPKVGASFRRGTVFAPIQSTYEKEATGMENPKMQSLFWCRKPTSQYGPVNHPVSCSAVLDRECKFSESRGFLSPRYRVCTNPIYI